MKKKDHYLKIVEWSEKDQCYSMFKFFSNGKKEGGGS